MLLPADACPSMEGLKLGSVTRSFGLICITFTSLRGGGTPHHEPFAYGALIFAVQKQDPTCQITAVLCGVLKDSV